MVHSRWGAAPLPPSPHPPHPPLPHVRLPPPLIPVVGGGIFTTRLAFVSRRVGGTAPVARSSLKKRAVLGVPSAKLARFRPHCVDLRFSRLASDKMVVSGLHFAASSRAW